MNIEELTIGQAKELASIFGGMKASKDGLDDFANGKTVIIRTYSAGVWFGNLALKAGNEVILENCPTYVEILVQGVHQLVRRGTLRNHSRKKQNRRSGRPGLA